MKSVIQEYQDSIKSNIISQFKPEPIVQVFDEAGVIKYAEDLKKAFDSDDINELEFEKGVKDLTKLQKKIITNSQGHQQTVYVRVHQDNTEHHFKHEDKVRFEHKGEIKYGTIKGLKHHEKFDPFGTATINDAEGNTYSKSLRAIEHNVKIPAATSKQAIELINDATEENRAAVGTFLTGKDADEPTTSQLIQEKNKNNLQEPKLEEITTRSGTVVQALNYDFVKPVDIELIDDDDNSILHDPLPFWCPRINLKNFTGNNYDKCMFDYVKLDDERILLSLNGYNSDRNPNDNVENDYAVVGLDQLVAIQDYYIKKQKKLFDVQHKVDISMALDRFKVTAKDERIQTMYYPFNYVRRLSYKQKQKYTPEQWDALSLDEKIAEIPNMKHPAVSLPKKKKLKLTSEDSMMLSNFHMYGEFVDKDYKKNIFLKEPYWKNPRQYREGEPCAAEYKDIREVLKWKKIDMKIQHEENAATYQKALETSYGDINAQDDLLKSHGVRIKLQNGKEMKANHIEQIRTNLDKVYSSFGNRKDMSKKFGLKISHSGSKLMFARKALGIYMPSKRAIGVSDSTGKFGFTLAHEFAHFIDNYVGGGKGRHYASEANGTTASKIANEFRRGMNKKSDSDYINRTCECFARAMEQYHATKNFGDDVIKHNSNGKPYHEEDSHVPKEKFNTVIKPLIETFLTENDHLMKGVINNLKIS